MAAGTGISRPLVRILEQLIPLSGKLKMKFLACVSLLIDIFTSALCLGCGGYHGSVSVEKKRADFIASSQLMATSGRNYTQPKREKEHGAKLDYLSKS